MVEVWLVELEQAAAALEAEERRRPRLDPDDLKRIAELNHDELRLQRRLSMIALRVLIAAFTGSDRVARAPFVRLPGGKPVLPGASVSFSVSHAAGRALIALSSGASVGVDIERQRTLRMPARRQADLIEAARALPLVPNAAVRQDTRTQHEGNVPARDPVLSAWVRLEALAKLDGVGMGRLLTAAGVLGRRAGIGGESAGEHARSATPASSATPDWPGELVETGVAVVDLALPADASSGDPWYAALAAPAALLQPRGPDVRPLPLKPEDLARLTP